MIFDSNYWPLALLVALVSAGIFAAFNFFFKETKPSDDDRFRYSYDRRKPYDRKRTLTVGCITSALVSLALVRVVLYYFMPSFQGSYFGYYWPLFAAVVPSTVLALIRHEWRGRTIAFSVLGLVMLVFVVPTVQYTYNAWGADNAQRFAAQPKIRIAAADEVIPPTDPNRMVRVTKKNAAFKGQTALTSSPDANLGSKYKIDADAYDLQSIAGHRYWVAPLEFANFADSMNFGEPMSPGYVVVDAQDPNKDAFLKLGYSMTLFEEGNFGLNLNRHLYNQGYTGGMLVDAKFEADDNWKPHWVVTYIRRPFGGIAGREITKVIVVDVSERTPKVVEYKFGEQPHWIERANPEDLIKEYAENWGMYSGEFAKNNYWSIFFGIRKDGTLKPSEFDLNYTTTDHSVWVMPMTSTRDTDHSVAGVLVADTTKNEMVYYPGLRGFNVGATVVDTMSHAPGTGQFKNFSVESVQLYSIYGELTWVGIYTSPQSVGSSYLAVGLLHAHGQNSADVVIAPDMQRALALYSNQLAKRGNGEGGIAREAQVSKEVSGKIFRISTLPGNAQQQQAVYAFLIEGDKRIFTLTRDTYTKVPFVQAGDHVRFSYLDIQGPELAVTTFSAAEIEADGKAAGGESAQPARK